MSKQQTESLFTKIIKEATVGNADQLKILIKQSSSIDCGKALIISAAKGHTECVKLLIPVSDQKTNKSEALRWSCYNGHAECAKLLISVSDQKTNNQALGWATCNGHTECVKILIPVSDPKSNKSEALLWAAEDNHNDCIKLLLPHSDISKWGENQWKDINSDTQKFIKSYYSKTSLEQNVLPINDQILKPKKSRKI